MRSRSHPPREVDYLRDRSPLHPIDSIASTMKVRSKSIYVIAMSTTVILNPMNPWLCSHEVRKRLLAYWETRQQQGNANSPLVTAEIPHPPLSEFSFYDTVGRSDNR